MCAFLHAGTTWDNLSCGSGFTLLCFMYGTCGQLTFRWGLILRAFEPPWNLLRDPNLGLMWLLMTTFLIHVNFSLTQHTRYWWIPRDIYSLKQLQMSCERLLKPVNIGILREENAKKKTWSLLFTLKIGALSWEACEHSIIYSFSSPFLARCAPVEMVQATYFSPIRSVKSATWSSNFVSIRFPSILFFNVLEPRTIW